MDGTFHSTGGHQRITRSGPATKLRVVGLILTALIGSALVVWVSRTTWERVDRLRLEFSRLNPESFYLGVRMKSDIQRLNDTLLRYRLRGERADYDQFYVQARELTRWMVENSAHASTPLERKFFSRMGDAYQEYLTESTNVLEASLGWFQSKAGAFPASYEKVQKLSRHLLDLCDGFIRDQRAAFEEFVNESNGTLATFQRLLRLSAVLVLALAAALVVLAYRGMIAPLQHRLIESRAIIARQEKLASLGVLAAGVAHEIRNPLTAIKFRLYSLKSLLPAGDRDNEDIAVIADEISRLERIVKEVLQFARPSEPDLVAMPANRVLEQVQDLLRPQLAKAMIELKLEPSEPAWVRADTHQIKEVLINLIQNSADSIGRDGAITLRVRNNGAAAVAIDVADTGKGMPPEVQQRLFDPFFTTKEGGTGLGLAIAARIIDKHGGELRYHTELDRGTTFSVVLPRIDEHETQNPAY